jgi:hypothetical protein
MGMTGHLQFQKTLPVAPDADDSVILFETKAWIPFAWYLFFTTDDLQVVGGEGEASNVLVAPIQKARAHARATIKGLHAVLSDRLLKLLEHFVESVAAAGDGYLVLDPHRINSSEDELTGALEWLGSFKTAEPEEWFELGAELFEDDDEGLTWEGDEDDERELDFDTKGRITGWPIDAQKVEWFASEDEDEEEEEDD